MSDQQPPPPPPGFGHTPPPPPGAGQTPPTPPSAPGGQYGQTPSPGQMSQLPYPGQAGGQCGGPQAKPPRPDVKLGALLTVGGSVLAIIGVFLPWASGASGSFNGMGTFTDDSFTRFETPGGVSIFLALVTLGLGVALFFAGRVLAVSIIAIVFASFSLIWGFAVLAITSDARSVGDSFFDTEPVTSSPGIGAVLQLIAPIATLAGAIVATAKRRRWPTT